MAATSVAGSVVWFWLMAIGGLGALPLGGAPLPLDPHLSAVAPPECLWYMSSAGQGEASADSSNQTEQLFAEPQVREFFSRLETQLMGSVRRAVGPGRREQVLMAEIPVLVKALVTRPTAMYVEEVAPREDGVDIEGAFLLSAGEQREAIEGSIQRLLALAEGQAPPMETETAAGVTWRRFVTPPQAPAIRFGWHDGYFVIAVGEATPEKLVQRMAGAAPEWLNHIREEHTVEREQSIGYLNVAGVVERIRPFAANHPAWQVANQLGVFSIQEFHGVAGYDAIGCVSDAHLATDGRRRGFLSLLPYKPLSKRDLQRLPKDSLVAVACRLDASEVWDEAVRLISRFEPNVESEVEDRLREIEVNTGVDVRGDVLRSLDDVWLAYLPSGDLMTSWINSAAAVRVKDAGRLKQAIDKLVEISKRQMAAEGRGDAMIVESTVGDNVIYSVQFSGAPIPMSPSWCVGDEWLVVGLLPSAIRSVLDRQIDDSLADAESVRDALAAPDGPCVIAYQDTPQLARSLYPWLQMGLQMASNQLRIQGIEIDATALPSVDVMVRHLRPDVTSITHKSDGFHFTSRSSLPGGGNMAAAAPVGVALLLPAVQGARNAARITHDMNSMKQIALACFNYESTYGHFPNNIYDDQGNAMLSWRVRLLPYLEEQELYDQFHLDEPWDSEHNRRLAARMPVVFQSASGAPASSQTRFQSFHHETSVFPGQQEIRLAQITDGTSNTLLFVQTEPAAAVEWTKPADIDYDPDQPLAGLQSPRGSFLTARCDGSVFRFELSAGVEAFKAMVTRNGGEPASYNR